MKIDAIELTDILRFHGTCRLDFRTVEPGLIALVAPNGGGKTSLIETVPGTFWRKLPSREDAGSDPSHYATSRKASMQVDFTDEYGLHFRARLNIDGQTRHTDAVLLPVNDDGTTQDPINKGGQVSTYKKAIAEILPSYELFCTSAFSAQGDGQRLIKASNSEAQDICAELLGLQRYAAMHKTAKAAADRAAAVRERLISVRDALAGETGPMVDAALQQLADALQMDGGDAEVRRRELAAQLETFDARIATVQDKVSAFAAASQRLATIDRELTGRQAERGHVTREQDAVAATLGSERTRITAARDTALAAAPDALLGAARFAELEAELVSITAHLAAAATAIDAELARILKKRDAAVTDAGNKITSNQQIQEMAADITAAVAAVVVFEEKLIAAQAALATRQAERVQVATDLRTDERAVAALVPAGEQLTRAVADSALLGTVPCGGAGDYAACRFLLNAAEAQGKIAALEAELRPKADLADRIGVHTRTLDVLDQTIKDLQARITSDTAAKAQHQVKAALAEGLAVSTERVAQLEQLQATARTEAEEATASAQQRFLSRRDELNNRAAAATAAIATLTEERAQQLMQLEQAAHQAANTALSEAVGRHGERVQALAQRAATLDEAIGRLTADLTAARADLDASAEGNAQAVALQQEQASARAELDTVTATIARVTAGHADLDRRRAALARARARLDDVGRRIALVETHLLQWRDLAAIMSRTGLQDLELDAAGPGITALVNEILGHTFGPRFSVELLTQVEKSDGGMKSEFSILVTDNEEGGEPRHIGALSGGEKVIVCEALMNAISIYVNQRSLTPIRTLFRDETGSALDPVNALRYVEMLRKVRELGGIHHIFFVSHNPEAAAMADAQIRIAEGVATIVRAPYHDEAA